MKFITLSRYTFCLCIWYSTKLFLFIYFKILTSHAKKRFLYYLLILTQPRVICGALSMFHLYNFIETSEIYYKGKGKKNKLIDSNVFRVNILLNIL